MSEQLNNSAKIESTNKHQSSVNHELADADTHQSEASAFQTKSLKKWLIHTSKKLVKFALLFVLLMLSLIITESISVPSVIIYLHLLAIFVLAFVMVVMLSIDNFVYRYLKASVWGQIVLYSLVALMSSQSYLWATAEVNRIFKVDPGVLGLTLTSMTALRFFEYTVAALLGSYAFAICLYLLSFFLRQLTVRQASLAPIISKTVTETVFSGMLLVVSISVGVLLMHKVSLLQTPIVEDKWIQRFAVAVDFNQYHRCQAADVKNAEAVVFLSASDILTAKQTVSGDWQFAKVKCD